MVVQSATVGAHMNIIFTFSQNEKRQTVTKNNFNSFYDLVTMADAIRKVVTQPARRDMFGLLRIWPINYH